MPGIIFREINVQDPEEGGQPIAVVDWEDRTLQMNTKLFIKPIAAAYTFANEDSGAVFICSAALTFTLPAAASAGAGCHCIVINGADTNLLIATANAGELVTLNDVAANSVALSTSSEKVGGGFHCICDGAKWYALPMTEETQTITVLT